MKPTIRLEGAEARGMAGRMNAMRYACQNRMGKFFQGVRGQLAREPTLDRETYEHFRRAITDYVDGELRKADEQFAAREKALNTLLGKEPEETSHGEDPVSANA